MPNLFESVGDWFAGLFGGEPPLTQGPPPVDPAEGLARQIEAVNAFWQRDPLVASQVAASEEALAAWSEIVSAAGTDDGAGTSTLVRALFTDPTGRATITEVARELSKTPLVATWLQQHNYDLRPDEKGAIFTVLTVLDGRARNQIVSLAEQYLRANPLNTEDDRDRFLTWMFSRGRQLQSETYSRQGGLGGFLDKLGAPYRAVAGFVSNVWANVADPSQAAWRRHLSLGQNVALSLGLTPADSNWNSASGGLDLISNFVLDPLIVAGKFAKGVKLARQIPHLPDASFTARIFGPAAKAGMPVGGRSVWTRLAYSTFAQTADELVHSPRFQKRVVGFIARTDDPARIVEQFPQFLRQSDLLVGELAKETNPATISNMMLDGMLMGEHKPHLLASVQRSADHSIADTQRVIDDLISNRHRVSVADWTDMSSGRRLEAFQGRTVFKLDDDIARLVDPALGEATVGFKQGARILDLSDEGTRINVADWLDAAGWQAKHKAKLTRTLRDGTYRWGVDPRADDIVRTVIRNGDVDGIRVASDEIALFGERNLVKGRHFPDLQTTLADNPEYLAAESAVRKARQHLYDLANQRNVASQIIVDLPDAGWRANILRNAKAKARSGEWAATRKVLAMLTPRLPHAVDLNDPATTIHQLDRVLTHLRVPRDKILGYKNLVLAAGTPDERYGIVLDVLRKAGDDIGNGHLAWRWQEFFTNNEGLIRYSHDTGTGAALHIARRPDGSWIERPFLPSELANSIPIPGDGLMAGAQRWRLAKKLPRQVLRGIAPRTQRRRADLANLYRSMAKQKGLELSDDEAAEFAFAAVTNRLRTADGVSEHLLDGRGLISAAVRLPHYLYDPATRVFKLAQLIGRPVAWTGRVLLEGEFRMAMAGLTSIFANPLKAFAGQFDTLLLAQHQKMRKVNQAFVGNTLGTLRRAVADITDPDVRLSKVAEALPGIRKHLDDLGIDPADFAKVDAQVERTLGQLTRYESNLDGFKDARIPGLRRAVLRQRAMERAGRNAKAMGLDPAAFKWEEDAEEILQRGWVNLFVENVGPATRQAEWVTGAMTPNALFNYGAVYGAKMANLLEDPVALIALQRIARKAGSEPGLVGVDGAALVGDMSNWHRVRKLVHEWAGNNGIAELDETVLAERYLETAENLMRGFLDPLTGGDNQTLARVADAFSRHAPTQVLDDVLVPGLDRQHPGKLRDALRDFVTTHPHHSFPRTVAARMDARFLRDPSLRKRVTNGMLQVFGEDLEQAITRRPAYLRLRQAWHNYYVRAGATPEAAREAARIKAGDLVNRVAFNMRESPSMFAAMERSFPFITAQYEVLKSWAYTLPMVEGGLLLGGPSVMRRVDRLLDSFVDIGLVRVEPEFDPDGNLASRRYRLAFDENPSTGNLAGDWLSKFGHIVAGTPAQVIQQFTSLRNDEAAELPEHVEYLVGSPYEPGSHGLMGVSELSLGMNPFLGAPLAAMLRKAKFAGDYQTAPSAAAETIAAFADRNGADLGQLLVLNRQILEDALGTPAVAELWKGRTTPETTVLPEGTQLALPGSSPFEALIEPALYPFGVQSAGPGLLFEIAPSWFQLFFRGFGLYHGAYTLDPDDREGFLDVFLTPISRSQVNGEVLDAIRHLEGTEGLVSLAMKQRSEFGEWVEAQQLGNLIAFRESGVPYLLDPSAPEAAEFQERWQAIVDLDGQIMARANRIAGNTLMVRGITGAFTPANPSFWYDEQKASDGFYSARDFADARVSGMAALRTLTLPRVDNKSDIDSFLNLAQAWWDDPMGDEAKAAFKQSYPYLVSYLTPKTFWAPGGPPPEVRSLEQTMRDIREGRREPLPPDIWIQRVMRTSLVAEREIEIRDQFGDDPVGSAQQIMEEYRRYREVDNRFDEEFAALDLVDDRLYEGSYARWRERNQEETLAETIREDIFLQLRSIEDIVDLLPSFDMPSDETRTLANNLKQMARTYREILSETVGDAESRLSPREAVMARYFSEVISPYFETLAGMFAAVIESRDTEEQARIRAGIRDWQDSQLELSPSIDGVPFPNSQQWQWGSWSDEERTERLERWSKDPIAWLTRHAVQRLVEKSPGLSVYLPDAVGQLDVYREGELAKAETADMFEAGAITSGQRTKINQAIEQTIAEQLIGARRTGEVVWERLYPIQRLHLAGLLPASLQPYVPAVNSIVNALAAAEVGPTSQIGRKIFSALAQKLLEDMGRSTVLQDDFYGLLDRVWEESTFDRGFARLFMADNFGEL